MANIIQFLRSTTPGSTPPVTVAPGEPVVIIDQLNKVDLYVGDSAGTPVLVNPAVTPIGGITLEYRWNSNTTLATPPAIGDAKLDGPQTTVGGATTLSLHETTNSGADSTPIWPLVKTSDFIVLFEQGGGGGAGGETFTWQASGPAVDMGSYWNIPGSVFRDSGNEIDNNRATSVFWVQHPDNIATGDMSWTNTWAGALTPHAKGDVSRDGSFTMTANKGTTDRPAPRPDGLATTDRPGPETFSNETQNALIHSGVEFTITQAGLIKAADVWILDNKRTYTLVITVNDEVDRHALNATGALEGEWVTALTGSYFLVIGDVVEIALEAEDSNDYVETIGGASTPAWAAARGVLRFNDVDQGGDGNGYGVRALFQPYTSSDDWDLLAYSGSLSASGVGSVTKVLDYAATEAYTVNTLVMEAGYMYRANQDITTPEVFDIAKWDATTPLDMGTFV